MVQIYDFCLDDFPRLDGETSDSGRFQRAIDAAADAVLYVPKGTYEIDTMLKIENFCSLMMHKSALLVATKPMDYVLYYNGGERFTQLIVGEKSGAMDDYNLFITGGCIDGKGLASCLCINGYHHYTLKDITLLNGKHFGLNVGEISHGYELIATNVYCKCVIPGLAGNIGICTNESDSHYTDCVVIDYTRGVVVTKGGSNRFTRCHVWGGIIPPAKEGEDCEMLKDSVAFDLNGWDNILRDCYADTAKIGFRVNQCTTLSGCNYFNNYRFRLDDVTAIEHNNGALTVMGCRFTQCCPHFTTYRGIHKDLTWIGNVNEDHKAMYSTGEAF